MNTIDFTNKSAQQAATEINENFSEIGQGGGSSAKHLNILVLGNSYSCDAWSYVPFILKEMGITCSIGIFYVAAQSIKDMLTYYDTPNPNQQTKRCLYSIDTRTETAWKVAIDNTTVCTHLCIVHDDWDIIAVQQAHTQSGEAKNFGPTNNGTDIKALLENIIEDMDKPFLFGWSINHIHANQTDAYYEATLQNIKTACEMYNVDIVFPCGTAVMDAQLNSTLNVYASNLLNGDGIHLNEGLPCYIAALANVEALLRMFYPWLSVVGDETNPTSSWLSGKNIPDAQGSSVGFGESDDADENAYLAQKMAIFANDNPFTRIGGNCTMHVSLTNVSASEYTASYGAYINREFTATSGAMSSLKWRRASENEWHDCNIYVGSSTKWYLQMYITEDIYVEAKAE